jgi:hypothetical protein
MYVGFGNPSMSQKSPMLFEVKARTIFVNVSVVAPPRPSAYTFVRVFSKATKSSGGGVSALPEIVIIICGGPYFAAKASAFNGRSAQ